MLKKAGRARDENIRRPFACRAQPPLYGIEFGDDVEVFLGQRRSDDTLESGCKVVVPVEQAPPGKWSRFSTVSRGHVVLGAGSSPRTSWTKARQERAHSLNLQRLA